MGLSQTCLAFLTVGPLLALGDLDEAKLHSLYLMQKNQIEESIQKYREFSEISGRHDFDVLQQIGSLLLQKGIQSEDQQTLLMTLFGAGLSGSVNALEILEKGMDHPDPQIQLLALHFLAKIDDDKVFEIFNRAMSSEFLAIRMEAVFCMAQRKHPHTVGHLESLMVRLPPAFKSLFPPLFALVGTTDGVAALRRLIEDPDPQTRIASILQVARSGRDDFLPLLRKRLTHSHVAELEAAAFAVSVLKDTSCIPKLKKLASSQADTVRIAASLALYHLGDRSCISIIETLARKNNLFAISSLAAITETEEILLELIRSTDFQVRTNAAIALLQKKHPSCLPAIAEILILDARGLAFQPISSVGHSLTAFKAIPSADLRAKDPNVDLSYSLSLREQFLKEAAHLEESHFLQLARLIFTYQQNDLVPCLIALLENLQTSASIALLKEGAQMLSSPLIRDYCNLSLYRLKEEGPYEDAINHWVMRQKDADLIKLRAVLPLEYRIEQADYTLSPEETSRLLIETFLAIASQRDEKSISFLLEAIQLGNPKNRYALMGLLMKATE